MDNSIRLPPIHPLSAIILVAVDSLWLLDSWVVLLWIITIPLSFLLVFISTLLIQKFVRGDTTGKATAYAMFLAILAAVPFPVTGTAVGLAVLSWAGFNSFSRNALTHQPRPPSDKQ